MKIASYINNTVLYKLGYKSNQMVIYHYTTIRVGITLIYSSSEYSNLSLQLKIFLLALHYSDACDNRSNNKKIFFFRLY